MVNFHVTPTLLKMDQNLCFSITMATITAFFIFFSCDPDRAFVDGYFGVLHDLLYASIDEWEPENPKKCPKSSQIGCFMVAMVTILSFFNLFLLNLIGLDYTIILVYYMTHVGGSRPRTPGLGARKSSKISKIVQN